MNTPYFSVLIPTKGRSLMAAGAVESALRQTFSDLEVIVVDNDDGEATRQAVAGFKDPRIRHVRTGGLSMPDNWEAAFSHMRGEYAIAMCDKQALKSRALEKVHRLTERERHRCLRWPWDTLNDVGDTTFLHRADCSGETRLIPSGDLLQRFTTEPLRNVNGFLPLPQASAYHKGLVREMQAGPAGRVCPPTIPDYNAAFQALAYADVLHFVDDALMITSTRNSNGRSCMMKTALSRQFVKETGGRESTFDQVPVKTFLVHNSIYNDFVMLQGKMQGRLARHPLDWSNYFIDCRLDIQESVERGVDMTEELAAWSRALDEQTPAVRQSVQAEFGAEDKAGRKGLRHTLKEFRRVTGIRRLEWAIKDRLYALTGKNQTGCFATPLAYVKWEHGQERPRD
jgi:hypothetical protein